MLSRLTVRPRIVVVDVEATCWEPGAGGRRGEMETIEIGAVLVRSERLEPLGDFGTFVRPVIHPVLSDFCRKLTTIRQEDVDSAPAFPEAFGRFLSWLGSPGGVTFASWGDYDHKQLQQDGARHGLRYPFEDHFNVKKHVAERLGWRKPRGLGAASRALGLALAGTHHRGIDDARNIVRVLRLVEGQPPDVPGPRRS